MLPDVSSILGASKVGELSAPGRVRRGGRPFGAESDIVSTLRETSCRSERRCTCSPERWSLPQRAITTVSIARWRFEVTTTDFPSAPLRTLIYFWFSPAVSPLDFSRKESSARDCSTPSPLRGESRKTDPSVKSHRISSKKPMAKRIGSIRIRLMPDPLLKISFQVLSPCRMKMMSTLSFESIFLNASSGSGRCLICDLTLPSPESIM
mmetsp:Transcript_60229/g.143077  ORF Transcript_60229/g.143077 Transcript_60229/m.143077 type:complete len:208 (-) Transcript_60229:191-814(-)